MALQSATDSFLVPISPRLIFVANDTTQKRKQFRADGGGGGCHFRNAISVQELQELATTIRGASGFAEADGGHHRGT